MASPLILGLAGSALAGLIGTVFFTHVIRQCARPWGLFDRPTQDRKMHSEAMPTGGGIAIAGGIVIGAVVFYGTRGHLPGAVGTWPFWSGALLMLAAGCWDDKYEMNPKSKFLLQLIAAYLLLHAGVYLQVDGFSAIGGDGFERALYSIPLSLLWVVTAINAVNLIDGLDGLAAGVIGIALLACAALFGVKGSIGLMGVGIVAASAVVGFLPYNFKPASIFMGDSGSLFLGYLLAACTLQEPFHADPFLALLILPMILGVPVLDTGAAIIRRLVSNQAVFAPDHRHIHHRLVAYSSERGAVLLLYGVGAWFGSAAVLMAVLPAAWGYALVLGTVTVALVWTWRLGCLTHAPLEEQSEEDEQLHVPEDAADDKAPVRRDDRDGAVPVRAARHPDDAANEGALPG